MRSAAQIGRMVVPVEEISRFIKEVMMAVGTVQEHAEQMADLLVAADYRGHYSHGLNRLGEWRLTEAFHGIY
jgi:LDH2 family malate/lactate/ureidoglycolate dehydrogenase